MHSTLLYLILSLFALSPQLSFAAQICLPTGAATGLHPDQSTDLPFGQLANALNSACQVSGAMQNGFNATWTGWFGKFTGCSEMGSSCSDILGKNGGNGGDYLNLVNSCKGKAPDSHTGTPYFLGVAPDATFHGGLFEHIYRPTGKACGTLVLAPGSVR